MRGNFCLLHFLIECKRICDNYSHDEMTVYAAQACFFIVLAIFPFLMLLLSLIQFVPMINRSDLLVMLIRIVPDTLDSLVAGLVDELFSDTPMAILSATAITTLWSASRGILSIERGLNRVQGIEVHRNFIIRRIVCSFYTIIFSVICILSLMLLVFGDILQKRLLRLLDSILPFDFPGIQTRGIITMVVLFFFFLLIYSLLPARKLSFRSQMPGAVFAATGWSLFSMAFSLYFKYFGNYAITYGSLTAVVLLMLWLYFGICILFLGAEINRSLTQHYGKEKNLHTE